MRGSEKKLTAKERMELRRFREAGVSIEHCASYFGQPGPPLSHATVYRYLRELREKMGPEKLPRMHTARSPLTRRSEQYKQPQTPINGTR